MLGGPGEGAAKDTPNRKCGSSAVEQEEGSEAKLSNEILLAPPSLPDTHKGRHHPSPYTSTLSLCLPPSVSSCLLKSVCVC